MSRSRAVSGMGVLAIALSFLSVSAVITELFIAIAVFFVGFASVLFVSNRLDVVDCRWRNDLIILVLHIVMASL